jgi:hypothetical protein
MDFDAETVATPSELHCVRGEVRKEVRKEVRIRVRSENDANCDLCNEKEGPKASIFNVIAL